MHSYDLILTLAGGLSAALILGYLTHRLGLSPIVGYLLAGTLVGPHTPGFVADPALVNSDAQGSAWFFKLKLANPADADGLMDEAAYKEFTA